MSAGYGPSIVRTGLVLHLDAANTKSYPGSGTEWNDLSLQGHTGTLTGPTFSTANGGRMDCDGVNDVVTVPSSADWAIGTTGSIEMWLKHQYDPGAYPSNPRLFSTSNAATRIDAYLNTTTGILGFKGATVTSPTPTLTKDTWYHLVFNLNAGVMQIYINGVSQTLSGTTTGWDLSTTGQLHIADYTSGGDPTYNLNASIPIFKIYKGKALTEEEVNRNYNATRGRFETETYGIDHLVVAGGGGGSPGGGGAGGYVEGKGQLKVGVTYPIIVGAGGAGSNTRGANGSNSQGPGRIAIGGGGGARVYGYVNPGFKTGSNGGSGGGSTGGGVGTLGVGSQGLVSKGVYGQGFRGGYGADVAGSDGNNTGGGGGGAGEVGGDSAANATGGAGGDGRSSSIDGTPTYRGGGGGGGLYEYFGEAGGIGGLGGGGTRGIVSSQTEATNGTINTGGGGGGRTAEYPGPGISSIGGDGGSGVVILRILTTDYSGTTTGSPAATTDGSYTILTYNSSGSYTA